MAVCLTHLCYYVAVYLEISVYIHTWIAVMTSVEYEQMLVVMSRDAHPTMIKVVARRATSLNFLLVLQSVTPVSLEGFQMRTKQKKL